MSVRAMTWAWEQDLKTGPKFVLVALADHSDGAGVCWPGHELIAEKCGLSRQTVVEHIAMLERELYLKAERTRDAKGREGKARYFLQLDRLSMQPPESEKPTLARVGISAIPESGFPTPYKVEPKAIEPKPPNPLLFEVKGREIEQWFELHFWRLYPKRVNKAKALLVLKDQRPDAQLLAAMLEGLNHRLEAERAAKAKGEWFRAWPDPHRFLRPSERRWEDRFDVPRGTQQTESYCCFTCGGAAVLSTGKRWYCRSHDPKRQDQVSAP
jgi:hypothetical protein